MSPFGVSVRLWFLTVSLNGIFWGIGSLFSGRIGDALVTFPILIIGFVVTLPLLIVIVPLVRLSKKLPYHNIAKTSWVVFAMVVIIILFYAVFGWIVDGRVWRWHSWVRTLAGFTIAAVLVAGWSIRKTFTKLYTTS